MSPHGHVFALKNLLLTDEIVAARADAVMDKFVDRCIRRHVAGDWGDVSVEDVAANDGAAVTGERVLSIYDVPEGASDETAVWIVSDGVDEPDEPRVTTVMFRSEY